MLNRKDEYRREHPNVYGRFHDQNLPSFYWYSRNDSTYSGKDGSDKDEIQGKLQPFKAEKNDLKYIVKTLCLFASFITLLGFALSSQANGLFHTSQDFSSLSAKKAIPINNR
jgi:hypothetical protein